MSGNIVKNFGGGGVSPTGGDFVSTSAGAADATKGVELDDDGKLDNSLKGAEVGSYGGTAGDAVAVSVDTVIKFVNTYYTHPDFSYNAATGVFTYTGANTVLVDFKANGGWRPDGTGGAYLSRYFAFFRNGTLLKANNPNSATTRGSADTMHLSLDEYLASGDTFYFAIKSSTGGATGDLLASVFANHVTFKVVGEV